MDKSKTSGRYHWKFPEGTSRKPKTTVAHNSDYTAEKRLDASDVDKSTLSNSGKLVVSPFGKSIIASKYPIGNNHIKGP